jgi:hypothetical protein
LGFVGALGVLKTPDQDGCGEAAVVHCVTANDFCRLQGRLNRVSIAQSDGGAYGEC